MNNMVKQINTSHLWMTSVGFVWRQLEIVTYQLKKKWLFKALLTSKIQNWICPTDMHSNNTVSMKSFYNQRGFILKVRKYNNEQNAYNSHYRRLDIMSLNLRAIWEFLHISFLIIVQNIAFHHFNKIYLRQNRSF